MSPELIRESVIACIIDELGIDPNKVVGGARLDEDMDIDSLDVLSLLMSIEQATGINIPDEALETIKTVEDLVAAVQKRSPP